jgi:hypothetical protein
MEQSILLSTKKVLHIGPDDESFDLDIMTHINSAFSDLHDLGVGPDEGFTIEDDTVDWEDFPSADKVQLNRIKTFVFLKTKLAFDPPQMAHLLSSMERQLEQTTWRLNVAREATDWVDPNPPEPVYDEDGLLVVPGGETVGFDGGGA